MAGMWLCSQQISTTPEWLAITRSANWGSCPTSKGVSILSPRWSARPWMVW